MRDKEKKKISDKRWYERHKEEVYIKQRKYYLEHKAQARGYTYKYHQKIRERVLAYYGQGKIACAACGYNDIRALSIDHCDNDGAKERKELTTRGSGYNFYLLLEQRGYPDGYLTLCRNCQSIKEMERRVSERLR